MKVIDYVRLIYKLSVVKKGDLVVSTMLLIIILFAYSFTSIQRHPDI